MSTITREFTKEQLIEHITRHSDEISRLIKQQSHHDNEYRKKLLAVNEIALAALTAEPVYFVEIEGDQDINAGRIPGSTFDFNNVPDGVNKLYAGPSRLTTSSGKSFRNTGKRQHR